MKGRKSVECWVFGAWQAGQGRAYLTTAMFTGAVVLAR